MTATAGTQRVKDVMTSTPITVPPTAFAWDAARLMKEQDIGDVIVVDGDEVQGIVTDRDLVVRVMGEGRDPSRTAIGEICSGDLHTVSPSDPADEAIRVMREHALRRLPVIDDGRPVGVVSIGDLAVERDPDSALADISAAAPNQ
ncbi:MAG TPA: CBS domain-containing protein [Acidimicrobiia bacterium]